MTANQKRTGPEVWQQLISGNKNFVSGKTSDRDHKSRRAELVSGQSPEAIVLTCSDSRTPPELIFDSGLGELFVVRTAGNIADPVDVGSMEYAAEHLGCSVLVVLAHTSCGAVGASLASEKMPTPSLQRIRDKIAPAIEEARRRGDDQIDTVAKINAMKVADDILQTSEVISHLVQSGKLSIVPAWYDLATGEVSAIEEYEAKKSAA